MYSVEVGMRVGALQMAGTVTLSSQHVAPQ